MASMRDELSDLRRSTQVPSASASARPPLAPAPADTFLPATRVPQSDFFVPLIGTAARLQVGTRCAARWADVRARIGEQEFDAAVVAVRDGA